MIRAGDKIGPYTLVRKLGRGTFGVVWLAEKRTALAATKVALKLPNDDEIDLEAIRREAAVWVAASGHPNVLPIIDADIYDEQVVIVSEYAPDGSLADWLKQNGGKAPTMEAAVEMTSGILDGLAHLHARRIIHRDLKPANILLQGRTPRLVDFGLARVLKSTSQSTNVSGTYAYMPPEAFDGKRSEQTDVWSAGVILYQMLTGRLPYPQTDDAALIGALLQREPEPPPSDLPPALREVLSRALRKNLAERYQSVVEMREALREAARGASPHTRATGPSELKEATVSEMPMQESSAWSVETIVAEQPLTTSPPTMKATELAPQVIPETQSVAGPTESAPTLVSPVESPPVDFPVDDTGKRRGLLWFFIGAFVIVVVLLVAINILESSRRNYSTATESGANPATSKPNSMPSLKPFQFETVKVDAKGNVTERSKSQGQSYSEDLGGGVQLEMVKISAGTFTMGSPESEAQRDSQEGPQHQVSVREFYLGKFEVTQAQWRAVARLPKVELDLNPDPAKFKGESLPVDSVSWKDAQEFCARLSKATGREYHLPSEAEWEYAARAGTQTPFAFGETITPEIANYDGALPYAGAAMGTYREKTTAVGSLGVANGFGLYDMHGNVWEWCEEGWHADYKGAPTDGSAWLSGGDSTRRVLRGGCWFGAAGSLRSGFRVQDGPDFRNDFKGFRLAAVART